MADKPVTREEKYLAYLTGDYKGELPKPITRKEKYLYELCLKGIGGEISPEEIKNAVNEYLEKNPVKPGATTEQAQQIEQNKTDIASLKADISTKITKFYASNQGETHITDSDDGKIQDMMIYGKSSQDGTPTPENPVEIKSVVNPTVKVRGKNLFGGKAFANKIVELGGTLDEANGKVSIAASAVSNKTVFEFPDESKSYTIILSGENMNSNKQSTNLRTDKGACNFFVDRCSITTVTGAKKIFGVYETHTAIYDYEKCGIFEGTLTYDDFEPYHEQTVTLPYILNAIPVSSGGNVTINGQQYIADYVDVERGKLVKKLKSFTVSDIKGISTWGVNKYADNITGFYFYMYTSGLPKANNEVMTSTILRHGDEVWGGRNVGCAVNWNATESYIMLSVPTNMLEDISSDKNACASFVKICENTNAIFFYSMASPIETDLTPEEIEAFKELVTYYPVTNISVNSEQLDGSTVFNYPISMKNGWDYVKKQLNDNRDYIYDMDLQSAEAYVNSEYAVALTELEV